MSSSSSSSSVAATNVVSYSSSSPSPWSRANFGFAFGKPSRFADCPIELRFSSSPLPTNSDKGDDKNSDSKDAKDTTNTTAAMQVDEAVSRKRKADVAGLDVNDHILPLDFEEDHQHQQQAEASTQALAHPSKRARTGSLTSALPSAPAAIASETVLTSSVALAAESPYFMKMLSSPMQEGQDAKAPIVICVGNAEEKDMFKMALEICHTRTLPESLAPETLMGIFLAANRMQLSGVLRAIANRFKQWSLIPVTLAGKIFMHRDLVMDEPWSEIVELAKRALISTAMVGPSRSIADLPLPALEFAFNSDLLPADNEDDVAFRLLAIISQIPLNQTILKDSLEDAVMRCLTLLRCVRLVLLSLPFLTHRILPAIARLETWVLMTLKSPPLDTTTTSSSSSSLSSSSAASSVSQTRSVSGASHAPAAPQNETKQLSTGQLLQRLQADVRQVLRYWSLPFEDFKEEVQRHAGDPAFRLRAPKLPNKGISIIHSILSSRTAWSLAGRQVAQSTPSVTTIMTFEYVFHGLVLKFTAQLRDGGKAEISLVAHVPMDIRPSHERSIMLHLKAELRMGGDNRGQQFGSIDAFDELANVTVILRKSGDVVFRIEDLDMTPLIDAWAPVSAHASSPQIQFDLVLTRLNAQFLM